MFSKTATMKSTNACYDKISRLKHELELADAVIIGAGAGLSTSAGLLTPGNGLKNISGFHREVRFPRYVFRRILSF